MCSAFKIRTREEAKSFFRDSQTNSCSIQRWQNHSRCDTNPPTPIFPLTPTPVSPYAEHIYKKFFFLPNIESLGNASQSSQRQKIFLSHASLEIPLMKHEGKKGLHSPPAFPRNTEEEYFLHSPFAWDKGGGETNKGRDLGRRRLRSTNPTGKTTPFFSQMECNWVNPHPYPSVECLESRYFPLLLHLPRPRHSQFHPCMSGKKPFLLLSHLPRLEQDSGDS